MDLHNKPEPFLEDDDEIFKRYMGRLVARADDILRGGFHPGAHDPEGAALSALYSVLHRLRDGSLPQVRSGADLWVILIRKLRDKAYLQKRKGSRELEWQPEVDVASPEAGQEVVLQMKLLTEAALQCLPEEKDLRRIAELRLSGLSVLEIGSRLNMFERTVWRRLRQIKEIWAERLQDWAPREASDAEPRS
jgi:DNA-directed RNA polymerase specialized sigma24 family protein